MSVLQFTALFAEFMAESWRGWRERVLARVTPEVRELFVAAGRGSGKSRVAALLACAFAAREYKRAPGERIYVGIFAPDRKQAGITFRYVLGLLRGVPELAALVVSESADSVELSNGVTVEVLTASTAAPRGRSYALAIVEEAAFLPQDASANPDVELLRALRPALARVPGSLLAVFSSPYARRGALFEASRRAERGGDPSLLYVSASTLDLNPTFDAAAVEKALADDPVAARTEYLAEFRADVESYVSREAVEACVVRGRRELPPRSGVSYRAFVDPSGGSADSFCLAVGHRERDVAVVDCTRERRPPFSPESVVAELAAVLKSYGVTRVAGDRYAGEWPREAFRRHSISYEPSELPKSDLYKNALAVINASRVELPDDPRLVTQLVGLERRTGRGGRDSIDHPPGAHDDLANVVCGLAVRLTLQRQGLVSLTWGDDSTLRSPEPGAVYVLGVRLTERHVRDCLAAMPDEYLQRYTRGQLPREEAVRMAARWLRARMEMSVGLRG